MSEIEKQYQRTVIRTDLGEWYKSFGRDVFLLEEARWDCASLETIRSDIDSIEKKYGETYHDIQLYSKEVEDYGGCNYTRWIFSGRREETDAEWADRINVKAWRDRYEEERELAAFKKLKEKYGDKDVF